MSTAERNRLRNWENENQQQLLSLAVAAQDLTKQNLLRAARITSFLLYIVYGGAKAMIGLAGSLFVGPQLIQRVGPGHPPLERHEFEKVRNPYPTA